MNVGNTPPNVRPGMQIFQNRNVVVRGYSFSLSLTFDALKTALNTQKNNWNWIEKDGNYSGEYLSCRTPSNGIFRIFSQNNNYMFDYKIEGNFAESQPQSEVDELKMLLSSLGANNFQSTENNY